MLKTHNLKGENSRLISPTNNPKVPVPAGTHKNLSFLNSSNQNESNQPLVGNKNKNIFNLLNNSKQKENLSPKDTLISKNSEDIKSTEKKIESSKKNQNSSSRGIRKTLSRKSYKEDENKSESRKDGNYSSRKQNSKKLTEKAKDKDKELDKEEASESSKENKKEEEEEEEENESEKSEKSSDSEEKYRQLEKRDKICDTDSEDDGSENEKEVPWIIMPDNIYKRIWDLLISCIILYSSIMIPYELAFIEKTIDTWIDTLLDVLLWSDIVVTFFSAKTDSEENLIKNHKQIVLSYLKTWFVVDVISVLPINRMTRQQFTLNKITRISRLPKIYRLVKLTKLLRMTKITTKGNVNKVTKFFLEKLKINANIERLIIYVLTFLILNHLCACFWYYMAKLEDFSPDSWVVRLGYVDSSNFELYIISFYWTLTTVTTVGYGDIHAGTTIERVYNLFIMSFGVLIYSLAIGSLSSIVSSLDQKTAEMNQKLKILSSIKKEFNLDQNIYDKVRKVIKFDLSRNQKDKMMFLQELPGKLRLELSQIMHDKAIQDFVFFQGQPKEFFAYVAPLLKPVKFSQNDYLYKCQDIIDESNIAI